MMGRPLSSDIIGGMPPVSQPGVIPPPARVGAPQGPIFLAAAGVTVWALWLLQWLVVVAVLRHDLFASEVGGVRNIGPSAGDVATAIRRHAGPVLLSGVMLLATWRRTNSARPRLAWSAAVLACLAPIVLAL